MERIEGLKEYVKSTAYREALDLPKKQEEEYTCWRRESII